MLKMTMKNNVNDNPVIVFFQFIIRVEFSFKLSLKYFHSFFICRMKVKTKYFHLTDFITFLITRKALYNS